MQLHATLETGNKIILGLRNDEGRTPMWYGAHCYNIIKNNITFSLAITLAKLFDLGSVRFKPNRRDVASIPLLLRLVRQKRCISDLIKKTDTWPGRITTNEKTVRRRIDSALSAYSALKKRHRGRKATENLKNFRDKKLAHSLIDVVLTELPRYEDLSYLLSVAMEVAGFLHLPIADWDYTPSESLEEAERQSEAFWSPAITAIIESEKPPAHLL